MNIKALVCTICFLIFLTIGLFTDNTETALIISQIWAVGFVISIGDKK